MKTDKTQDTGLIETTGKNVTPAGTASNPIDTTVNKEILTPAEQAQVDQLVPEIVINIDNDEYVRAYGSDIQEEIAESSKKALGNARMKDASDASQKLVHKFKKQLVNFKKAKDPKGIQAIFENIVGDIQWLQTRYTKISEFIDDAKVEFEKQAMELTVDLNVNKDAKEINIRTGRQLIVFIKAGKIALETARSTKLVELKNKATETEARSDIDAASQFSKRCDEWEIKMNRLDCSLAIAIIRDPEIDLLLESQRKTINLLDDIVVQAIPLWYNEMLMALDIKNLEKANKLSSDGAAMTRELFLSNLDGLSAAAIRSQELAETGVIDTATIITGTDKLLTALEAVKTSCQEAEIRSRQYEIDRSKNNDKITKFRQDAMKEIA